MVHTEQLLLPGQISAALLDEAAILERFAAAVLLSSSNEGFDGGGDHVATHDALRCMERFQTAGDRLRSMTLGSLQLDEALSHLPGLQMSLWERLSSTPYLAAVVGDSPIGRRPPAVVTSLRAPAATSAVAAAGMQPRTESSHAQPPSPLTDLAASAAPSSGGTAHVAGSASTTHSREGMADAQFETWSGQHSEAQQNQQQRDSMLLNSRSGQPQPHKTPSLSRRQSYGASSAPSRVREPQSGPSNYVHGVNTLSPPALPTHKDTVQQQQQRTKFSSSASVAVATMHGAPLRVGGWRRNW